MSHGTKRARLSPDASATEPKAAAPQFWSLESSTAAEIAVGITEYLTPDAPGFTGILKQRYTDFLVNEIDSNNNVVHLTNLKAPSQENEPESKDEVKPEPVEAPAPQPKEQPKEVAPESLAAIAALTNEETAAAMNTLLTSTERNDSVTTPEIADKDTRSKLHMAVREAFNSRLLTVTEGTKIVVKKSNSASRQGDRRRSNHRGGKNRANQSWAALGGEFCHFTVYKENRDTMEIASLLARMMRLMGGAKTFSFAGTKDKRAVTVQRFAAHKVKAEKLAALNKGGPAGLRDGIRLGDFTYAPNKLDLGDLIGNEFVITLRQCQGEDLETQVRANVEKVKQTGFANYFGLQRFGSSETVSTSDIGIFLLNGEFRTAVEKLLSYDPAILEDDPAAKMNQDDVTRAEACRDFFKTYDFEAAAKKMPRRFLAERSILDAFGRRGFRADETGKGLDYLGAIQAIPRGLRMMYVHAYQSLVWNNVTSARLRLSCDSVIPGDLVIQEKAVKAEPVDTGMEVDQDGEIVIAPEVVAYEDNFVRARPVTDEEFASGKFSIRDVVLPTPGWDIVYPANPELYKVYTDIMSKDGVDPLNMKRAVKDWSLPGSYRKIVSDFVDGECGVEVKTCAVGEQVVATDLEKLSGAAVNEGGKRKREDEEEMQEEETVVVLRMRLGTSCYATMALRELMKGGTRPYRPEFGRPTERT